MKKTIFITLIFGALSLFANVDANLINDDNNVESEIKKEEIACSFGKAYSCFRAGKLYQTVLISEKNYQKAATFFQKGIALYQKACDDGDINACHHLGDIYDEGKVVRQDFQKAIALYKKACDTGIVNENGSNDYCRDLVFMYYKLGHMYNEGKGAIKQDFQKAADLYKKACDNRFARGCYHLGVMYIDGKGVEQDETTAKKYIKKACDLGYEDICYIIKDLSE